MKINPYTENMLSREKGKVIEGDDFAFKIVFPFAIRYMAHGKTLTFGLEPKQREGSWWIFGGYLAVYVQLPLCWDNEEEPISAGQAELIKSRLKEMLDRREKKRYEFVYVDESNMTTDVQFTFKMGR